ncbi:hypothetical protein D0C16_23605 [Cellvibrio sp. KY-GH-1]|uniref:hypothetical protein n=1 Tax=Cellvibrio sp. KY-GH-1 TaxID=2303332 RepID=UPI001244D6F9|nr:hypothetical protein [Cellvibrio sp. KY-GH-1]QEY18706.1 hypothetical protein D0C16_23605 [Cellvibrio sp. KY-GH-1]
MNHSRYNIYTLIHKGLRASLCQNLVDLGKLDDTDAEAVAHQLEITGSLLNFCRDHLEHENNFIHPVIQSPDKNPLQTIDDHYEHETVIDELQHKIALIKNLHSTDRTKALESFYGSFSLFVAENFTHMRVEETHNVELLWKYFSDEEIHSIEQKLVASLTPEENLRCLLMILPNITHMERTTFLQGFRHAAPADVFNGTLAMLKPLLTGKDWLKLTTGLHLDLQTPTTA